MHRDDDHPKFDDVRRRSWVPPLWLMVFVLFLVLLMTGYGFVWYPLQVQNAISRQIQNLSGSVVYQENGPDWVRQLTGFTRSPHPVYIKQGGLFDQVTEVRICPSGSPPGNRREIPIELIRDLKASSSLKRLDLSYTNVTDDWMPAVSEFDCLESLDLSHARISGRGFHQLSKLPHLKQISMVFCPVRGQYLDELVKIKSLKDLNLYGCSHLTPEDVQKFELARPDVRVNFNYRSKE